MSGIDLAAMLLLICLLVAWARQRGCDNRHDALEREHTSRRRVRANIELFDEAEYRHDLRVDLEIAQLLEAA